MSELYGWAGNILDIDLGSGRISKIATEKYAFEYIGGKGLMHCLAWEHIPKGTSAFSPDNCLMLSTGPLTGTPAPTSGRMEVGGVSPQSIPEMYSHSGIGGWFGPKLKYSGFDAVIIRGAAPSPCYVCITDGNAEIRDARYLWGLGTYATQHELKRIHGKDSCNLVIGPAGEKKSRIAIMLTDSGNAAGQGGFGGVAGSKNLKAISVKGSGSIRIARPVELLQRRSDIARIPAKNPLTQYEDLEYFGQTLKNIPWPRFKLSCSQSCDRYCMPALLNVPRSTRGGFHCSDFACIGKLAAGWQQSDDHGEEPGVEWPLWSHNIERGLEVIELTNDLGLNQYEILGGMVPWLVMCAHEGLFSASETGLIIEPEKPEWWVKLLNQIAYRQDFGDLLAEGTSRAISTLGKEKFGETIYTGIRRYKGVDRPTPVSLQQAWGYAAHYSGRGINASLPYPDWLLRALTWMTQTRDSNNDTHHRSKADDLEKFKKDPYKSDIGPKMAIWDEHRSEIKCSLTLCDWAFPIVHFSSAESKFLSAVTGRDTSEEELDFIGERLKNLQRAVLIRNHDRSREQEVNEILPFFKRPDGTTGSIIDEGGFSLMVDNYYKQRGWDTITGWPTRTKYEQLGLGHVADEMARLGLLPN
ncbi:MAG: aldehyde ferredoxin oxidoreductase N-terminal domain-containing protein [Dehalococcoidales bacterium]|nr:aldehyde ferredoxin oxidoreductase N-terminal domain-containing protein [Dehalococcoidales bacterium]